MSVYLYLVGLMLALSQTLIYFCACLFEIGSSHDTSNLKMITNAQHTQTVTSKINVIIFLAEL